MRNQILKFTFLFVTTVIVSNATASGVIQYLEIKDSNNPTAIQTKKACYKFLNTWRKIEGVKVSVLTENFTNYKMFNVGNGLGTQVIADSTGYSQSSCVFRRNGYLAMGHYNGQAIRQNNFTVHKIRI